MNDVRYEVTKFRELEMKEKNHSRNENETRRDIGTNKHNRKCLQRNSEKRKILNSKQG